MLEFSITTLRYPTIAPVRKARATQYWDGEVVIPLNEMRNAKVTFSMYDPIVKEILPLERMLFVRYLGIPVFWGPIVTPEWDYENGLVTVNALGPEFRLVNHYLGLQDAATSTKDVPVLMPVNGASLRTLRDAANNLAGQTTRGVPDLGIVNGTDTSASPLQEYEFERGSEVWQSMQEITGQASGPDMEFEPLDWDANYNSLQGYAKLNTWLKQGTDKTDTVIFHYGFGKGNLENFIHRPGGDSVVTHAHILSEDGKARGTATAVDPSARFGVYVEWTALQAKANEDTLREYGRSRVLAYGEPPDYFEITPKLTESDGSEGAKYLVDFGVGDVIHVAARKGYGAQSFDGRVTQVTLSQGSIMRSVKTALDCVPRILQDADVIGGDS